MRAEDMRVVLREPAHAHQSVQRAGRLVTVAGAELGQTQRQLAIGLHPLLEDLHMAGAVHRLDRERQVLVLDLGDEHVLAVVLPMARHLPELAVDQERRLDLLIAGASDPAADIVFQRAIERIALRVPEHLADGLFLHVEEVHLAADLAVVALLRLLDALEIGLELLLVAPGGAVDALQLRIARRRANRRRRSWSA